MARTGRRLKQAPSAFRNGSECRVVMPFPNITRSAFARADRDRECRRFGSILGGDLLLEASRPSPPGNPLHDMKIPALLALTLPLLSGLVQAEIQVTSGALPATSDYDGDISMRSFDPARGVLESVTICVTAAVDRRLSAENLDSEAALIRFYDLRHGLRLALPGDDVAADPVLSIDSDVTEYGAVLAQYDTVADFGGSSGFDSGEMRTMQTVETTITNPTLIARFVGTRPIAIPLVAGGRTVVEGPANMVVRSEFRVSVRVALVYNYVATATR